MKKKQTTERVLHLILALVLTLSMVLSLTACVGNSAPTEPPATEPSATNPPATEPSATEPPATEPPATEPPATEAPTEAPTEEPTEAPTEAPTEPEPTEEPTEAPTEEPTEAPTEPVVEVTFRDVDETVYATSAVNVRSGPGSDNTWLGSLSRGESVKRIGIGSNGWDKVVYNGETAYIFSDYLSRTQPVDEHAPTEPPATNPPATEPPATQPPATEPPATEDDPYDFDGYTPATITYEVYSTWDRFKQMCFRNHFSSSVSSMTPEVRHNYDKATLYEGYTCTEHDDHCRDQYDHDRLMRNLATPCPYCGQLNCPSYLHVDPRDLYFETVKCEQYNELKDPMVYCQTCGKRTPYMGCDDTQVCTKYLADAHCIICGVWTEGGACHTCRQEDIDNYQKGN